MVTVASLLNPMPPFLEPSCELITPDTPDTPTSRPSSPSAKRFKVSKSTMVMVKAQPNGEINYPPHETQELAIQTAHEQYRLEPRCNIRAFPKHIPYNSDKKSFQEKTGRDAFEVYSYSFRMPDDDGEKDAHVVMWDYNVGLVRITSLFKSLRHAKTMPAKVMSANPGLKEISHSITGGSIFAQGYWIPFEAAKAIAARLCWDIRYVLTPVFGVDFPNICLPKSDPLSKQLSVGRDVIARCTETADMHRRMHEAASSLPSPQTPPRGIAPKTLRPKPMMRMDYESGYCTDTDRSLPTSPQSDSIQWTPVNKIQTIRDPYPRTTVPTPMQTEAVVHGTAAVSVAKDTMSLKRTSMDRDGATHLTALSVAPYTLEAAYLRKGKFSALNEAARAAGTLMRLCDADAALAEGRRSIGHRSSR